MEDITSQTLFSKKDAVGNFYCELIIINAHSPHSEEKVIAPYLEKYPNIIYEKLDFDPGLYAVWNRAIEKSRGEFVTNANLDDRLAPQSLELHLDYFEKHPETDIVYSNNYWTEEKNETFEKREQKQAVMGATLDNQGSFWSTTPPFSAHALISGLTVGHHPMWRKSIHARFGWFDITYKSAGDWEMWCRSYVGGARFAKLPQFLGSYYKNPTGLSTSEKDQPRIHKEAREVYEKYKNLIK
jgi:glycosyltransferase involved in cell wall biosynthesis